MRRKRKKALNRFGKQVYQRLNQIGMNVYELEELVESKTGLFLRIGYLKKHLNSGHSCMPSVRIAIREILGIPEVPTE